MKKEIANFYQQIKRPLYFIATLGIIVPLSSVGIVLADAAGGQVQERSIIMSDDGVSGSSIVTGVGSGTNVTYRVTFRPASSYTLKGIVLDFCSGVAGTPFIGDATCAAPTNFTVGATPVIDDATPPNGTAGFTTAPTGIATSSAWSASSLNSGQTLKLTNADGLAVDSSSIYTFAVTGVTNPSQLGTFYGRLITYASDTGAIGSYTHSTPGTYQDYGGFALSTANVVQVTAKVQESLAFCVLGTTTPVTPPTAPSLTAPTSCSDATATPPVITLGHGDNNTLDSSVVDTNGVYTFASTNALHGLIIRMHNSNSCGGLSIDSGVSCGIPPVNAGADTPGALIAGITSTAAAFGMFCNQATANATTHTGNNVDCDASYYDSAHSTFPSDVYWGMNSTTANDSVVSTYGDTIAKSTGPTNSALNEFDFAATASDTTPAGIYKANLAMIATGTF